MSRTVRGILRALFASSTVRPIPSDMADALASIDRLTEAVDQKQDRTASRAKAIHPIDDLARNR